MKRILLLTISACILTLISCENGSTEIAMEYQLTADVNPTNMIKGLKGANNEDFFTSDDNLELELTSYIYDDNGDLVEEKSVTLDNFYDTATFKSSLPQGTYTVVYSVCVCDDGDPIWNTKNKSSLYNLSYSVVDGYNEWAHILGIEKKTVTIMGSKEIDVELESVGSFTALVFTYGNDSSAAYLYLTGDKKSISYSAYNEESSIYTASEGYIAWSSEDELSPAYSGSVLCFFFLPLDDMNITWQSYSSSLKVINSGSYTFDSILGDSSVITTNIDTGVTTRSADVETLNLSAEYKCVAPVKMVLFK